MATRTIQKQINIFIKRAKESMNVEKIILYGSAMRPNAKPHDIDLIVIGNFPTDDPERFLYDLYTDIPRTVDFHVYGIDSKTKQISPFLKQALSEGHLIYT